MPGRTVADEDRLRRMEGAAVVEHERCRVAQGGGEVECDPSAALAPGDAGAGERGLEATVPGEGGLAAPSASLVRSPSHGADATFRVYQGTATPARGKLFRVPRCLTGVLLARRMTRREAGRPSCFPLLPGPPAVP